MLTFQDNAVWLNVALFVAAGAAIWYAGTKLEHLADVIARRTGLGHAFVGVLLLAAVTSLPEIATTATALWIGNASLAVHNLLGSVVFNTAVLVVADLVVDPAALTHRTPRFVLLITGVGVVFLLGVVVVGGALATGVAVPPWLPAGTLWGVVILLAYAGVLAATYQGQGDPRWQPVVSGPAPPEPERAERPGYKGWPNPKVYWVFGAASLGVLIAGWTIAQSGDALATQTGLGASFVGFVLVGIATSLPEISTTVSAARAGNDEMAFANIFGSSAFVVALLAVVGVWAGAEGVRHAGSPTATFAAGLGILVMCVYLWGLLERRDRAILRMGWDSIAVLVLTLSGCVGMYLLGQ
jgi:cation:H+ antiporter